VLTDLSTSPPNGTAAGNPPAIAAAQSASVVVRRWYPNGSCRRADWTTGPTRVHHADAGVGPCRGVRPVHKPRASAGRAHPSQEGSGLAASQRTTRGTAGAPWGRAPLPQRRPAPPTLPAAPRRHQRTLPHGLDRPAPTHSPPSSNPLAGALPGRYHPALRRHLPHQGRGVQRQTRGRTRRSRRYLRPTLTTRPPTPRCCSASRSSPSGGRLAAPPTPRPPRAPAANSPPGSCPASATLPWPSQTPTSWPPGGTT
jgi:hypothetical protein